MVQIHKRSGGLVVRRPSPEWEILGLLPAFPGCTLNTNIQLIPLSRIESYRECKAGTQVAGLPCLGVWPWCQCTVCAGEMTCLVCNFCLGVAARTIAQADRSLLSGGAETLSYQETNSSGRGVNLRFFFLIMIFLNNYPSVGFHATSKS